DGRGATGDRRHAAAPIRPLPLRARELLMRKALVVFVFLAACAHQKSLYQRWGGEPVVAAIVDAFVERFADDTRVAPTFAKTDIPKFKKLLNEQICNLTGGGCKYTGRSMPSAHEGMHITESQFNAIVEDLQDAMN